MDSSDGNYKCLSPSAPPLFSYAVLEEPNLSARKTMEDFTISEHALTPDGRWSLFCVLDGHGGREAASFTKREYPNILRKLLSEAAPLEPVEELISQSIQTLSSELFKCNCYKNGSTLSGVLLDQTRRAYYTINIGDSRVLKVSVESAEGSLKVDALTEDHKVSNEKEYQRIRKVHKLINKRVGGKLSVTRALGDFGFLRYGLSAEPDIFRYELTSEKHLIIGTDGVWDGIDDLGLRELVHQQSADEPKSLARSIVERAVARSEDNLSLIVVSFIARESL